MFCQNCGHVLNAEVKFCGECGAEVTVRVPSEKPFTFEQFMASRGAETSGGTALDVQFNTAQKTKQKERSGLFKPKGKKKTEETVKVYIHTYINYSSLKRVVPLCVNFPCNLHNDQLMSHMQNNWGLPY